MSRQGNELTFAFLDDLALAAVRRRVNAPAHLASSRATRIGPFLELAALDRCRHLPLDALPIGGIGQRFRAARRPSHTGRGAFAETPRERVGFIQTCRDPEAEDQVHWMAFCRKAQEAAELSLPKAIAQGLIGTMREIEENVHLHSGRAHDGIVGFRGTRGEFEFAVTDNGIGILKSLRQSPDYGHLNDSGIAMKVALSDGQSRLRHVDAGRGYGFHDLFVGLANLNGELRFRSEDHALTINGTSPALIRARLDQKVGIPGFLANVVCGFTSPTLQ